MGILDHLLERHDVRELSGLDDWWALHRQIRPQHEVPVDAALAIGPLVDRLAWVFASGYQAAGEQLFGQHATGKPGALCATELGGAHPRAIETRLSLRHDGYRIDGHKTFVTMATFARRLFVLASEGEDPKGRKILRVVRVDPGASGVELEELGSEGFVPEIPHARLTMKQVRVGNDDVLPGDGWQDWVKPFRTVEDCHIHAGLLAWLAGIARRTGWPIETVETILELTAAARTLALTDPRTRATHLALGSLLARTSALLEAIEPLWAEVDEECRERWNRDRPLLLVASKARAARLAAARHKD